MWARLKQLSVCTFAIIHPQDGGVAAADPEAALGQGGGDLPGDPINLVKALTQTFILKGHVKFIMHFKTYYSEKDKSVKGQFIW